MKEALLALLLTFMSGQKLDSTIRATVKIDTTVTNADSAIAVELYKAKINLDRLSGK